MRYKTSFYFLAFAALAIFLVIRLEATENRVGGLENRLACQPAQVDAEACLRQFQQGLKVCAADSECRQLIRGVTKRQKQILIRRAIRQAVAESMVPSVIEGSTTPLGLPPPVGEPSIPGAPTPGSIGESGVQGEPGAPGQSGEDADPLIPDDIVPDIPEDVIPPGIVPDIPDTPTDEGTLLTPVCDLNNLTIAVCEGVEGL